MLSQFNLLIFRHDSPDKLPNNPLNDQESLNSNLIGFDLQGIDFTLCSIAGNENQGKINIFLFIRSISFQKPYKQIQLILQQFLLSRLLLVITKI